MGWAGVISREIRGIPDEGGTPHHPCSFTLGYYETRGLQDIQPMPSWMKSCLSVNGLWSEVDHVDSLFWAGLADVGALDTESDIYSFNFSGYSGSFYFDENRNIHFKSNDGLKAHVEYDQSVDHNLAAYSKFKYFIITTPEGVKYYFGGDETGVNQNAIDRSYTSVYLSAPPQYPYLQVSAWHLVKVVSPNNTHEITLDYEKQIFKTMSFGVERASVTYGCIPISTSVAGEGKNHIMTEFQEARLLNIISSNSSKVTEYTSTTSPSNTAIYADIYKMTTIINEQDLIKVDLRDSKGNIIQFRKYHGEPTSLIWGHNQSVPVAKIINANIDECAYTSFEDNVDGGWTYNGIRASGGNSGNKSVSLSGNNSIVKNNVQTGNYIISYWQKYGSVNIRVNGTIISTTTSSNVNDYVLKSVKCSLIGSVSTIAISGSGTSIDDLRLHPVDAMMTTIVYNPNNLNVIAMGDENNKYSHYQYDDFGRLVVVKDFNHNMLVAQDYEYDNINALNSVSSYAIRKEGVTSFNQINGLLVQEVGKSIQYIDGVGRSLQQVGIEQSPLKRDVVSLIEFDAFGKQSKQYLPYTSTTNGGSFRSNQNVYQSIFYGSPFTNAYSEVISDSSTLGRLVMSGSAGSAWKIGSGHEKKMNYRTNFQNEIRLFDNYTSSSYYAPNTLFVNESTDQDGNLITTYTDKMGREIMVDNQGTKTYTVYDTYGRLAVVIPPKAFGEMETTGSYAYNLPNIKQGLYSYVYDGQGRVIRKDLPGKDVEVFFYDRLDRPILTIDANDNKSFTKYDVLGRPIMTGLYHGNGTPSVVDGLFETNSNSLQGYTENQSFPTGNIDVLSVNYYDHYDFDRNGSTSSDEDYIIPAASETYSGVSSNQVHGMATGAKIAVFKQDGFTIDKYLNSRIYYDKYGRVIEFINENITGEKDVTFSSYNFTGLLTNERVSHRAVHGNNSSSSILDKEFIYDHAGRLLKSYLTINGGDKKLISQLEYNEKDQLKRKSLGGNSLEDDFLQKVDYFYNIRGWLIRINNPNACGSIKDPVLIDKLSGGDNDMVMDEGFARFSNDELNKNANNTIELGAFFEITNDNPSGANGVTRFEKIHGQQGTINVGTSVTVLAAEHAMVKGDLKVQTSVDVISGNKSTTMDGSIGLSYGRKGYGIGVMQTNVSKDLNNGTFSVQTTIVSAESKWAGRSYSGGITANLKTRRKVLMSVTSSSQHGH